MLNLAEIFQSGMVLQRLAPLVLWGTAEPEAPVEVTLDGRTCVAGTDSLGNWRATLPPRDAGRDLILTVRSGGQTLTLTGIAVGEVWIAGGQSNMEFWLRYEKHRAGETRDYPDLRFFDVPKLAYEGQERDFDYTRVGVWRRAVGEERDYFSAVGYYFQKSLAEALGIPVGIVGCNWGGTPSCAWMSQESVERAGHAWLEADAEAFRGMDPEAYARAMARKPDNATGDPFHSPFNEFMLPRTPVREEIEAFLAAQTPLEPGISALPLPQNRPGVLYERMVKAIAPFPVRGVLWYQGESDDNGSRGRLYRDMLAALMADWRRLWDRRLPFLIVQLPGWESWFGFRNNGFSKIRECQRLAVEADPDAYLCSISDAGERFDIHPKDKRVVGERLAALALRHVYGKAVLCDPPFPAQTLREGRRIEIAFKNSGTGLEIRGGALRATEATDAAGRVDFEAAARGDRLTLTLRRESGPVTVRHAGTEWFLVNLYNSAGIPAIPFCLTVE